MVMHSTKDNLQILYEDNHLIIINKRVGDIVQGDKTGDVPLSEIVKSYIKEKYHKPGNVFLGVVHRLDRPTSGVVIFAKTSKALSRLNGLLRDQKIHKIYLAIVKGQPVVKQQTLTHYLIKNPKNNKSTAFETDNKGRKKAVLHYKVLETFDRYSLLEIALETGRHHQIRAQLSKIGHPIKGDLKYGFKRSNKDAGILLHAYRIQFEHPVTKVAIHITAPPPDFPLWNHYHTKNPS